MKIKYTITFLLFLIVLPLISAQPPVTTVAQFPTGYFILDDNQDYVNLNTDFTHHWFLYNSSNGKIIDNTTTNCSMFIADITGTILMESMASYTPANPAGYWSVDIGGGNFSSNGFYSYGINCQDGQEGGAMASAFETKTSDLPFGLWDSGIATTSIYFIFLLSITFIFLGYLLTNKESIWTRNIGLLLILIGFIFMYYDLVMVNAYSETIVLSTSANLGVFKIFIKFIKLMPYIIALISGFAIIKFLREVVNNKKSKDGWDNNNY